MRQVPFKSVLVGLAIFGIGIGGFIQLTQSKPKAETRETISSAWRVSTQYARLQTVSPVFNGFGSVQNPDTQTLKARVLTDVTGLYAREGTRVHAGQLLVELDATEAEIKLSKAKANLADAKSGLITLNATEIKDKEALNLDLETLNILTQKLTRILDLKKRNLTSEQDLDTARQAVVTQKTALDSLKETGLYGHHISLCLR